ncbi:serine/threonine-protein kinase [Actinokineospora bangkokensis]|uniref:serine/threonine-protein kinase n=1 Tax=Actinokineospora bangkokensis TaxID=1193682 RepID=UPI000A82C0F1|nr:serine/threonine-protein kinase [Actinokineospora bangkokensis]
MLETIGSGAMGIVWKAEDERLQRVIAIKQLVVRPGLDTQQTEEARRRAMREARIAARLQHRNAIAMLDVAEHDGEPCLVMEFLPSRSLSAVLAERGTLPPEEVAAIGSQVAAALAAAHSAGIVHRDVKPGNILLDDKGTVKITDFGISRAIDDGTVTETGMLAGTPAYLAPEVARGQDPSRASDVFSLGAALYHALEGAPPFGLNTNALALLHAVASGRVPPPRNAGRLTDPLMSLLSVDPADRPTMEQAISALTLPTAPLLALPTPASPTPALAADQRTVPARPAPPQRTTALPPVPPPAPARPAAAPAPRPAPQAGAQRGVLVGAALVVVALAAAVVTVILTNSGGETALPPAVTSTVTVPGQPPQQAQPTTTTPSSPPQGSAKVTDWGAAGRRVIEFYGDAPLAQRWAMLGPNAQAVFGGQAQFEQYWGAFAYVASRDANGVSPNADGSVTVPVEVTTKTAGGAEQVRRLRVVVVSLDGQLLIDSDPR